MFKQLPIILTLSLTLNLLTASAYAAVGKTYQVTGTVLEVNDKAITVQKNKENFEIARDATTVVKGEPIKGKKVTVQYRMTAANIDTKTDKTGATEKSKKN